MNFTMKSGRKKSVVWCVIIISFLQILIAQTQTTEVTFTYDDTEFRFIQTTPVLNRADAQTQCVNWEGNLATIKSDEEDSLLFYSSPDIGTVFTCHIGLIQTGGGEFVWIDGSNSSYRNWGIIGYTYPVTNTDYNCVRTRYRLGGTQLSQGWLNVHCSETRNCYICSKQGMSNGCGLIYESSCYKVFEVNTPINWLDSQSSCAIWGGDLTSITTERENNYLNTIITSSVGNCWIGLNDRDTEGMYTWIDGTAVTYTNWTTPPDFASRDCFQINNAGNGMWESVSCDITLNAFLCKRDSSSDIPTVGRFGRITDGAFKFEELTGNTFFFESQTLVCGSDGSSVVWEYSQNSDLSDGTIIPETSNYVDFSWLDVVNTMQGYYRCKLSNSVFYTVGVYDTTLTTVAVTGASYTYIVGVDRTDVLLLGDPKDGGSLNRLRWSIEGGMELKNPINLNSESNNLPDVLTTYSCVRGGDTFDTIQICVKVPTMSISYGVVPVTSYSSVYPVLNTLSVPSDVQEIALSINIEGRWTLPDNSESTNSILTIPNFSSQNNGVYKFYTNNWDGVEVCAIQIELTITTTVTGEPDVQLTYDNTLFGYFSDSPSIDWYSAQLRCLDWGGNLATIKSEEEDSLLYYSTTDIQTYFACYIGLNDILNEAGTDENLYTWVDGSSSDYRNFETGFPLSSVDRDCVRFRYKPGGVISEGWIDQVCSSVINCHFCSQPATSGDCDLIHGSSCYKVFEVSTPINWLDAQSSCAIWGGDLTSITTERENNFLNTIINSSIDNCWIGLNDRDTKGMYTWIDGTTVSYTNWTGIPSNTASRDCFQINNAGNGMWESVNCEDTSNTFVCKRPSNFSLQGDITPIFINYTVGSIQILYYPNDDVKKNIKWTPDEVKGGDTDQYSIDFPNPVEISTILSAIGTGVHTMTAFYRMSPVTLIRSIELAIKDTVEVTISYENFTQTTSDVSNQLFPSPKEIAIQGGTKNIKFSCNMPNCTWKIENQNSEMEIIFEPYDIDTLTEDNEGTYSLIRKTRTGQEYLTAQVYINVTSSETGASSSSLTIIIVIVVITIIAIICLIVIVLLIIICVWKRRTSTRFSEQKLNTDDDAPSKQESLTKDFKPKIQKKPSKEYIELRADPNRHYMTIDESSMMPLQPEHQQNTREYHYLANIPAYTAPYEEIPETYTPSKPYEKYVPMSSVKSEELTSRIIPIKQFPTIYQQYVASGMEKDSLLSVEFIFLNEESKINVDPPVSDAVRSINVPKNPIKNIIPFNENRIVLDSPYFDCNYINASYITDYQFIATIHPTKATHRDFLQMIHQTEAHMVIMLTTRREKAKIIGGVSNRVCYWPKKDEPVNCEPFVSTLINSTETTAFVKQEISLRNNLDGKEHTFTQCISPIWNEDSTVGEIPSAIALLNRILKQLQDDSSKSIIIHCEDGISKTGIILTGITSVKELTLKKTINFFNTVKKLRRERMKMVPTLACYTTCYSLMNEYCSIHL